LIDITKQCIIKRKLVIKIVILTQTFIYMKKNHQKQQSTSWGKVDKWYNELVGTEGMHYHQKIILPKITELLDLDNHPSPSLLDVGCGQGILSRHIPENVVYHGIDISPELIQHAKQHRMLKSHQFSLGDATKRLSINKKDFSHASIILALQNMEDPSVALQNISMHLQKDGKLIIVMNHPCFRIPRQTHWGVDESKKLQYRRLDMYMSALKIPIQAKPSKGKKSEVTWSFHHPLSSIMCWLREAGFMVTHLEEWCSDKKSTGSKAKMENKSRNEFPLFLCIVSVKV
jgi:ubiquinone/menaquinone biosynthesis C-methylase UbiE